MYHSEKRPMVDQQPGAPRGKDRYQLKQVKKWTCNFDGAISLAGDRIMDVGKGGAKLRLPYQKPPLPGQEIVCSFAKEGNEMLTSRAIIRWCSRINKKECYVGIEFHPMAQTKDQLWVNSQLDNEVIKKLSLGYKNRGSMFSALIDVLQTPVSPLVYVTSVFSFSAVIFYFGWIMFRLGLI